MKFLIELSFSQRQTVLVALTTREGDCRKHAETADEGSETQRYWEREAFAANQAFHQLARLPATITN